MSAPILSVEGLSVRYEVPSGPVDAARDVSFSLQPGERLGLVGESGSGKTTTALALMGMLRAPGRIIAGRAMLEGTDLAKLDPAAHAKLRLSRIAYVPQGAMNSLNPVLRVRHSLEHGLRDHGVKLADAAMRARIAELLTQVDLSPEVADRYPHELSGGMKQRVCIALAISLGPRVIIADEPTSALDVVTQRQVMRTLHAAQARLGSAMILIGHDMGLMAQSVDRMAVMRDGRILEMEPTADLFSRPRDPYTRDLISSVPLIGSGARTAATEVARKVEPMPLLRFDRVVKDYGGAAPALAELSFTVAAERPQIISIVGQSGSGKTTLGSLALGFAEPSSGQVLYRGQDITALRGQAARTFRREVQAVFQDPYSTFNPFYRVDRALLLPLKKFGLTGSRAEAQAKMEDACRQVGLDPSRVLSRFAHQLSGGQRQRLMVARALMLQPRLLIADEPVSMVDASLRSSILDCLVDLRDRHGITILYITHDLATAYRVSDDVLVLHRGRVVEAGDPEAVFEHPKHPYTQLLLEALPWPDPSRPWGTAEGEAQRRREIEEIGEVKPMVREGSCLRAA